jgi:proteasome activator subunit 4
MVDSKDLHQMAAFVLVFVTAITPPIEFVKPLVESLLKTLRESPVSLYIFNDWRHSTLNSIRYYQSWKVRLHALPILSIVYYRELPLVDEEMAAKIMDVSMNAQSACTDGSFR